MSGGALFENITDIHGASNYLVGVPVAVSDIPWFVPMENAFFSPILRDWVKNMYEQASGLKATEIQFAM
ncbi:hypothetical protein H0X90_31230 [Burkholderia sp. 9775_39]|uniref:hypothetical protein n=1 Tax=unclassified Burkholderia TaxID=2613784 RepID=UPI0018C3B435|nr:MULTISPECIES: hypothetical protein [unclassified Burkholderia]MBG0881282.1 hypothetical protein [Burkholderia sp. 9775_39]MBG0887641.1 hypothetical protein [Burkholderia sp. 9773_38]